MHGYLAEALLVLLSQIGLGVYEEPETLLEELIHCPEARPEEEEV